MRHMVKDSKKPLVFSVSVCKQFKDLQVSLNSKPFPDKSRLLHDEKKYLNEMYLFICKPRPTIYFHGYL